MFPVAAFPNCAFPALAFFHTVVIIAHPVGEMWIDAVQLNFSGPEIAVEI